MREETVSAAQIDDASAAKETPHPARRLPGFVEFLARQAAGLTDGTGQAMKERVVWKAAEIVVGKASFRGRRERHDRRQRGISIRTISELSFTRSKTIVLAVGCDIEARGRVITREMREVPLGFRGEVQQPEVAIRRHAATPGAAASRLHIDDARPVRQKPVALIAGRHLNLRQLDRRAVGAHGGERLATGQHSSQRRR